MEGLKCCVCGKKIETIPMYCAQDIIFNKDANQWECRMGPNSEYVKLDEIRCFNCAEIECGK